MGLSLLSSSDVTGYSLANRPFILRSVTTPSSSTYIDVTYRLLLVRFLSELSLNLANRSQAAFGNPFVFEFIFDTSLFEIYLEGVHYVLSIVSNETWYGRT